MRLAILTGLFFGLVMLALACAGLSLPKSLGAIIGVLVGYEALVKHGLLPPLCGPWRVDVDDGERCLPNTLPPGGKLQAG